MIRNRRFRSDRRLVVADRRSVVDRRKAQIVNPSGVDLPSDLRDSRRITVMSISHTRRSHFDTGTEHVAQPVR